MKVILLSSDGSWFHNLGAAAAKAISPTVDEVFTTGGNPAIDQHPMQGVEILLVASRHGHRP